MRRHPFDPVALVFGLTFAGAAIVELAGGSLTDEGHFLLPACLLGLGIALLLKNGSRARPSHPTAPAGPAIGQDFADDRPTDDTTYRTAGGIEWPGPPPGMTEADARLGPAQATHVSSTVDDVNANAPDPAAHATEADDATHRSGTLDDLDAGGSHGIGDVVPFGADEPLDEGVEPAGGASAGEDDTSPGSDDPTERPGD